MTDLYQGDPKIFITNEGADFNFPSGGGQPEMEQGVENLALISLFTDSDWAGNFYFKNPDKKIGSNYEKITKLPITLSNLELMRQSSISALKNPAFSKIKAVVTAPKSNTIKNIMSVAPSSGEFQDITAIKNGVNWQIQAKKGLE